MDFNSNTLNELITRIDTLKKQKNHWQRVAGKHGAEIQRLKRGLEAERELARMWPRFEDGRPVRVGDEFTNKRGEARTVDALVFSVHNGTDCAIHYGVNYEIHGHGCPVKRPPLKAKDGQPIEEGTLLYGEDGRAWLVEGIDHAGKYPIEGSCDGEFKRLKAEWLTHEKPKDTLEEVVRTLRCCPSLDGEQVGQLADRIEKLAKGA